MGVKSSISLKTLNRIFPEYNFTRLMATKDGVVDTTYIVGNDLSEYILKKYERDIKQKISLDAQILTSLKRASLNVPTLVSSNKGWHLYTKLDGEIVKHINTKHIVLLARFMALFHKHTYRQKHPYSFIQNYNIKQLLRYCKKFYLYYKQIEQLQTYKPKSDGFIHGDIFKDNTLFESGKIGIFDFIDGGDGEFAFDIAVALMSFSSKSKLNYYTNLFLKVYNPNAPKKIKKQNLVTNIETAKRLYALLRINNYKNTIKAKELLF